VMVTVMVTLTDGDGDGGIEGVVGWRARGIQIAAVTECRRGTLIIIKYNSERAFNDVIEVRMKIGFRTSGSRRLREGPMMVCHQYGCIRYVCCLLFYINTST
jgi:hypothetical protein